MPNLTALEGKVLKALIKNADDVAGGDFGILGDIDYKALGLSGKAFGGVVTSLGNKGLITVHEPVETNGGPKFGGERLTQFTLASILNT